MVVDHQRVEVPLSSELVYDCAARSHEACQVAWATGCNRSVLTSTSLTIDASLANRHKLTHHVPFSWRSMYSNFELKRNWTAVFPVRLTFLARRDAIRCTGRCQLGLKEGVCARLVRFRGGGVGQDHVRQKLLTQRFANVWISQLNLWERNGRVLQLFY